MIVKFLRRLRAWLDRLIRRLNGEKDLAAVLARLEDLIGACEVRAARQRFDSRDGRQMIAVSLLATILELSKDCLDLLRERRALSPKILLRSLLEARAELVNVCSDPEYTNFMQVAELSQRLRLARAMDKPDADLNPFFADLLANEIRGQRRKEMQTQLDALKAEGYENLHIAQRLERAGESHRYAAVYWLLARQSHHNLGALESRHVVEVGGMHRIAMFKPEQVPQLVGEVDQIAGIVANAVADVSGLVDGEPREISDVSAALEALRSLFPGILGADEPSGEKVD